MIFSENQFPLFGIMLYRNFSMTSRRAVNIGPETDRVLADGVLAECLQTELNPE